MEEKKREQEGLKSAQEGQEGQETLESLFASLDAVVGALEQGETSLEESFALYQKGMEMLKKCDEKIDAVEKQVLVLEENGETHEF